MLAEWRDFEDARQRAYDAVTVEQIVAAAEAEQETDPDRAISLRVYAGYVEALKPELATLKLAYPNRTVDDRLEFVRGDRTIVVQWDGQGNTDGDLIVWLPKEQVLVTGDLLAAPIPYAFDSPMVQWRETLHELLEFNAALIIPGHGEPQLDNNYLQDVAALIGATVDAVRQAKLNGAVLENLPDVIDLEAQKAAFTDDDPHAINAWNAYYFTPGVKSAWASLGYPTPEAD